MVFSADYIADVLHSRISSGYGFPQKLTLGQSMNGVTVGNRFAPIDGFDFAMNGEIAEVLVYDEQLSATDIASVSTYIRNKWIGASPTADSDGDGDVDGADFLNWQRNAGTGTGATPEMGDADLDGVWMETT